MLSFLCFYGNSSSTSAALGASATKKRSKPRCLLKLLRPPVQRWNKTNISLPINFTHEMHIQADGIPRLRETALDTLPGIQNSAHTYPVAEITTTGSTDLSVPGARGGCDVSTTEIPWSQRGIYHHRSPYRNTLRYTERGRDRIDTYNPDGEKWGNGLDEHVERFSSATSLTPQTTFTGSSTNPAMITASTSRQLESDLPTPTRTLPSSKRKPPPDFLPWEETSFPLHPIEVTFENPKKGSMLP